MLFDVPFNVTLPVILLTSLKKLMPIGPMPFNMNMPLLLILGNGFAIKGLNIMPLPGPFPLNMTLSVILFTLITPSI